MKKEFLKKCFALSMAAVLGVTALTACGSSDSDKSDSDAKADSSDEQADSDADAKDGEDSESGDQASAEGSFKVGVFQYTQHGALDEANKGFVDALEASGLDCEIDQQNASGDSNATLTIAQKMVDDKNDLIFTIATPASQAVAGLTTEIPIVLTAVTDPAEADLVESNEAPGGNVTGTSDMNPVEEQVALLQEWFPDAKNVAVLYCSAEANSKLQAELVAEACKQVGITTTDYTVANSGEIQTVVESMVGKVDAIYAPTDNVIANAMATVAMIANENGIPVICGEENMVNAGGLATYSIDYYKLGQKAGEMAVQILKGEAEPATMPIEYLSDSDLKLVVNQETADALGIDVSGLEQ